MSITKYILFFAVLVSVPCFAGGKRYAEPGEGIKLNQVFVTLPDGRILGTDQGKVWNAKDLFGQREYNDIHQSIIQRLERKRYWESGTPPETPALERHRARVKEAQRLKAVRRAIRKSGEPPPKGG